MKLTQKQLRRLIKEEFRRDHMKRLSEVARRLDELHPGTTVGTTMKQGLEKVWEADKLFQQALAHAPDDHTHEAINAIHKAIEQVAFQAHDKMETAFAGEQQQKQKKRPLPQAKSR